MIMRTDILWEAIMVVSIIAAGVMILFGVASITENEGTRVIVAFAAAAFFIGFAIISYIISEKHKALSEKGEDVTYFRLKRPGVDRKTNKEIVPKGKVPKE
jgi:hypothetical protein